MKLYTPCRDFYMRQTLQVLTTPKKCDMWVLYSARVLQISKSCETLKLVELAKIIKSIKFVSRCLQFVKLTSHKIDNLQVSRLKNIQVTKIRKTYKLWNLWVRRLTTYKTCKSHIKFIKYRIYALRRPHLAKNTSCKLNRLLLHDWVYNKLRSKIWRLKGVGVPLKLYKILWIVIINLYKFI